jgi:hypothetical protein
MRGLSGAVCFDEEGTKRSRPSSLKLVGRVHTGKAVLH